MATTSSACSTFYFVHLDSQKFPISDTMFAKNTAKVDKGYTCREGKLLPVQMAAPSGMAQCFPKNGLRYFYKVNKQTNQILPGSFWSQEGKPNSMCSGVYQILEYKIFK